MITIALAVTFAALPPSTDAQWQTSYSAAYERAGREDKPIFLYFTNEADRVGAATAVAGLPALKDFVPVFVSKRTEEGRKLFQMFELTGDEASVVIERSRSWQYFRYERKLDRSDVEKVLAAAAGVRGAPMVGSDPLVPLSAYYSPDSKPATATTTTTTPPTTTVVPHGQTMSQPNYGGQWNYGGGWNSGGSYCPSCSRGRR